MCPLKSYLSWEPKSNTRIFFKQITFCFPFRHKKSVSTPRRPCWEQISLLAVEQSKLLLISHSKWTLACTQNLVNLHWKEIYKFVFLSVAIIWKIQKLKYFMFFFKTCWKILLTALIQEWFIELRLFWSISSSMTILLAPRKWIFP